MTNDVARDVVAEKLLAIGLVAGVHALQFDRTLQVPATMELPAPWNLPSRLFRFPLEVGPLRRGWRRIGLMHRLLRPHPFVVAVGKVIGAHRIATRGAPNEHGVSHVRLGLWWHAVDLLSAGRWEDLLATRAFTTAGDIEQAVGHSFHSKGQLSTKHARTVLKAIGSVEPRDRASTMRQLYRPSLVKSDPKKPGDWPVNSGPRMSPRLQAWSRVFGIEDGWLDYGRGRYLQWTAEGRSRYERAAVTPAVRQMSFFDLPSFMSEAAA